MRVKKLTKAAKKAIEAARIKNLQVDFNPKPQRKKKRRGCDADRKNGVAPHTLPKQTNKKLTR
jgi:hypothetical protein